ncbi:MAG: Gfo/Idh/MocA family oxidoreductase [archaeon]
MVSNAVVHELGNKIQVGDAVVGVELNHSPIDVGEAGAGGMMGPYHAADLNDGRIANLESVFDFPNVANEIGAAYGANKAFHYFGEKTPEDAAKSAASFDAFLDTHLLTVLSGPNNVHVTQAEAIFDREDADSRFVYSEKPPANDLEGATKLAELEQAHPGHIGVVSQNRMWDMVLEAKHLIANGYFDEITDFEGEYQQDWMVGCPAVWRIEKGIGGEKGPDEAGNLGKLIDIGHHIYDTLGFVTGKKIDAVRGAYVKTTVHERAAADGATFGAGGEEAEMVPVGGDTKYHGDDVLTAQLELEGGVTGNVKVSQTNGGNANRMWFRIYGVKDGQARSISFTTDDANTLTHYEGDNTISQTRNPGNLAYRTNLAGWIKEGLRLDSPPVEGDTPPKHDQGWRDAHRKQAQAFALYAQLITNGVISTENRSDLYMVPTAAEARDVVSAMKATYQMAAEQKDQRKVVDHL